MPFIIDLDWLIHWSTSSVLPQSVKEKTEWPSPERMSFLLKDSQLVSAVHLRPLTLMRMCSGTNNKSMTSPGSCYDALQLEKEIMLQSSTKTDLMPKSKTNQFLWGSRTCSCQTLLCTTVLWSPQWQETHTPCKNLLSTKHTSLSPWEQYTNIMHKTHQLITTVNS